MVRKSISKNIKEMDGVDDKLLKVLKLIDAPNRTIVHRNKLLGEATRFWCIPLDLAVKYKIRFRTDPFDGDLPGLYLTEDDWVSLVFFRKKWKSNGIMTKFVLGPLVVGSKNKEHDYFVYTKSDKIIKGHVTTFKGVYGGWPNDLDLELDPRVAVFTDLFLATGDGAYAAGIAYNMHHVKHASRKSRWLLKQKEVRDIMSSKLHDKIEKILEERGITEDAESWVLKSLMDTVDAIPMDSRSVSARINGLKLVADMLQMTGPKKEIVTREATFELTAEDKAKLQKASQKITLVSTEENPLDESRGEEEVTGGDVSESETVRGDMPKVNLHGEVPSVS